ncbi:C4-dicarboxylate ABC transporter [Maritimibacter sp. 55A14]|uniref:sensor histidine kinase n=1 Tax=Maritimibacter sp. 55A14 TaxID=2174844 RepID=UPI000D61D121|nr:ATP-binding protein [Maritimibacter sp. 55A14]PWE32580.1 C4-dicarboxylate ABC transporter [Maritimibacter sp. 55A14]
MTAPAAGRPVFVVTALFLAAVALFSGAVWWLGYGAALDQLRDRGRADLSLAADRLVGEVQKYRELAVVMAEHPTLNALLGGAPVSGEAARILRRAADRTGARDIVLVARDGRVLARAAPGGRSPGHADPALRRAFNGALGMHHMRLPRGARVFSFAAPIFSAAGAPQGAVLVDQNAESVEGAWLGDPQAVYFTDASGVVFVSNRSELMFRSRAPGDVDPARFGHDPGKLAAFPDVDETRHGPHEIWRIDGGRYLPSRALHLSQPLPVIGLTAELLVDTRPAARIAGLQAAVAAATCLIFGAVLYLFAQRRRALADRLAVKAAANAELERRVVARTRELSQTNKRLRREIVEREEAQAALTRAQDELVQASKLSALGQMSAGLSHELNQPLMAIRSFAENGALLVDRGEAARAGENLGRISELARRMGRIIRNLRAFARQENEPIAEVEMGGVVAAVLEMTETRIARAGVDLQWQRPGVAVMVRGGEVRLQQVVLNLVTNALDAMDGAAERRLEIALGRKAGVAARVVLIVRDTGPGIAEPPRIFDPFYTTKEVGRSEGMGLGLSISYGLVQSFGGAIRGENHPDGGAIFTVELDSADMEAVA